MENNNYVSVGNIIEQERLKRQAQIAKGVSSDVYDHIEKAHQDDLSKGVEMTDNLSRFADDVDNLNKGETEFLLSKLQRQIVFDPDSRLLKSFKSIAINHLNDLEKAHIDGEMHPNGKWVWVASANGGKGDWRTANGRAHKKHQETHGNKDSEGEKKTIDDHASGASTDALKRAAADENAKPEVREAAKKELQKRNGSAEQKQNEKVSSNSNASNEEDSAEQKQNSNSNSDTGGGQVNSEQNKKSNQQKQDYDSEKLMNGEKQEPSKMTPAKLKNAINHDLEEILERSDIHNDSPKWREGAYQVYKSYKNNNPMSIDKFERQYAGAHQDASHGLKMNLYFKARENGANEKEAEQHAQSEYAAFQRHINDPVLSRSEFKFLPFHKAKDNGYVSVISLIDSINKGKV